MLGAVGTYVYKTASDENKKKLLNYVKKAVDWLPEQFRGYIPHSILSKLEGDKSTGSKKETSNGNRATSGNTTGGSQSQGTTGFQNKTLGSR